MKDVQGTPDTRGIAIDQVGVILEDADEVLMTRGSDNRDKVSAILSLSDGMLSNFLRLRVICTMNRTAAGIDQALLRPGWLGK